ncbi:hypothetical protein [Haloarchaeobius sp. TZWSO28]|uniref:hypothetical protein n=1 Tax=Haloarchaeobius sp. TZWSO28 TaxID=3446119 RepID=UPI003EBB2E59
MIRMRETVKPLVPLMLTFVVVLTYHSLVSMVVSGVVAFVVTIALSVVTWYGICRVLFDETEGDLLSTRGRQP